MSDDKAEIARLRTLLEENGIDPDPEPVRELYGPPDAVQHTLQLLMKAALEQQKANLRQIIFGSSPLLTLLLKNTENRGQD